MNRVSQKQIDAYANEVKELLEIDEVSNATTYGRAAAAGLSDLLDMAEFCERELTHF